MLKTIREIIAYRQMIVGLVRKDLRGRYKGSVLGFLWTFINPLLQLVIYSFVFSTIWNIRPGTEGLVVPYYHFLAVALIPWVFISAAVTGGSTAVLSQKDLVKKIYFPREVLPISYVSSCFFNMIFSFVPVFIIVYVSCYLNRDIVVVVDNVERSVEYPTVAGLCCLPVVMLVEYILALGISMISSAVTVYFRDLEHILGIICMAWMYATPIVYTPATLNKLANPEQGDPSKALQVVHFLITKVNPMTPIIQAYRDILCDAKVPHMTTLVSATLISLVFLFIGLILFGRLKKHFAEEL